MANMKQILARIRARRESKLKQRQHERRIERCYQCEPSNYLTALETTRDYEIITNLKKALTLSSNEELANNYNFKRTLKAPNIVKAK